MKKKVSVMSILLLLFCLVLVASMLLSTCAKPAPVPTPEKPTPVAPTPPPAEVKPIELKLDSNIPPTHSRYLEFMLPWISHIEEETGGRVKITPYLANSLSDPKEKFDAAIRGISDIADSPTMVNPGRFDLTELVGLPALGLASSEDACRCMWHIYNTMPEVKAEFAGVKVLGLNRSSEITQAFGTTKKKVTCVEDMKGLKAWVDGVVGVHAYELAGLVPVDMPAPDVYLALEKGLLDAAGVNASILFGRSYGEVVRYIAEHPKGFANPRTSTFYYIMNLDTWNSLPPDIQAVFDKYGGDWYARAHGKYYDEREIPYRKRVPEEFPNIEYFAISDEEQAKYDELVKPTQDWYVDILEAKGKPARKVLDEILRWTKENVK